MVPPQVALIIIQWAIGRKRCEPVVAMGRVRGPLLRVHSLAAINH
jgi:hypothetical protein